MKFENTTETLIYYFKSYIFRYHWEYYWNLIYHWSARSNSTEWYIQILLLEITTETSIYILPLNINCMYHRNNMYRTWLHFKYHWNKMLVIIQWSNGIPKYHWENHWSLIYCWKVCSDTIESTIETSFIIE